MDFHNLSADELECYGLEFLLDKCLTELAQIPEEISDDRKIVLLRKLCELVIEFSPFYFGGN